MKILGLVLVGVSVALAICDVSFAVYQTAAVLGTIMLLARNESQY